MIMKYSESSEECVCVWGRGWFVCNVYIVSM